MGSVILQEVLRILRRNGIPAEQTRPGRKYPQITEAVAAVHILRAEPDRYSVTMEISVVCPGAMGAGRCEAEGLRICRMLQEMGARCVQHGYQYEGMARIGHVSIEATFTGWELSGEWVPGPGFQVIMGGSPLPWVTQFHAEMTEDIQPLHEICAGEPEQIPRGRRQWVIQLEQLIPMDHGEMDLPEAPFRVVVEREGVNTVYEGCRWTSVSRVYNREGLLRRCTGLAQNQGREE